MCVFGTAHACVGGITADMLGRFSSAEFCCLNPAERKRDDGRKQEDEAEKLDNGESEEASGGERCF